MPILNLDDPADRVLGKVLLMNAEQRPDSTFLISGDDRYTYGQVNAARQCLRHRAGELGVGRGDTVAFLMKTCVEFVFATFGAMKLGAIWVPTNVDYKGKWLRRTLSRQLRARPGGRRRAAAARRRARPPTFPSTASWSRGEAFGFDFDIQLNPIEELVDRRRQSPTRRRHLATAIPRRCCGRPERPGAPRASCRATTPGCAAPSPAPSRLGHARRRASCTAACRCTTRRPGSPTSTARWSPGCRSPSTPSSRRQPLLESLPTLRRHPDLHPGRDAHVPVAGPGAPRRSRQPGAPRFDDPAARRADPADEGALRHRDPRPGVRPERGDGNLPAQRRRHRMGAAAASGASLPGMEVALLDDDDRRSPTAKSASSASARPSPTSSSTATSTTPRRRSRRTPTSGTTPAISAAATKTATTSSSTARADFIRYKGRNISSFAVEAAVNAHPAVAQSAAHGVTSAELESEAELKVVRRAQARRHPRRRKSWRASSTTTRPTSSCRATSSSSTSCRSTPTGRVQKFKLRERGVTAETWDGKAVGFQINRG